MEIGPLVATAASPAVATFRPSAPRTARPVSALCFGASVGSSHIQPVDVTDTRAIREAAQHERDQEDYGDPLRGKSVEPRNIEMVTRSRRSVQNAVSLYDSSRVKAFQARAKGDYTRAIKHLLKAVGVEPSDHLSLFQLAVAYERTGELQRALATYERVISLDEGNSFAYFNVANILMQLGKVDDAIRYYSAAIQRCRPCDPHQLEFFRQRGAAYRKKGDFEKAARDYVHCHSKHAPAHKQDGRPLVREPSPVTESNTEAGSERSANNALHENQREAPLATNKIVYNADALHAAPELSEIPFDAWTREQVFRIAGSSPSSRTTSDLLLLADTLQVLFPFCSLLAPDACSALASKIVGVANVQPGTALFAEKMSGSHVFFVYRGGVSAHKTIVQHDIVQVASTPSPASAGEEVAGCDMQAWESVYAEVQQQERDAEESAFEIAIRRIAPVTTQWTKRQMKLCQFSHGSAVGFQGRHTGNPRTYSLVVDAESDLLALSWSHLLEAETIQRASEAESISRFLRTVPVFRGIPISELLSLSLLAKRVKPVGSKVVCSEGQLVDGVVVVREGEVCRISPSDLRLPPDLSISFNLCGSFAVQSHEQEKTGLEFFTQLEFADDPLAFARLSNVVHGFLPHDFVKNKLQQLQQLVTSAASGYPQAEARSGGMEHSRKKSISSGRVGQVTAHSLRRGAVFFASSSWIPPRKSRREDLSGLGVACAKSALITRSTAELLFFTSADLTASLSLSSRGALQRNAQRSAQEVDTGSQERKSVITTSARSTHSQTTSAECQDMLEQLAWTTSWAKYKEKLVREILHDKRAYKPRNCFQAAQ